MAARCQAHSGSQAAKTGANNDNPGSLMTSNRQWARRAAP